MLHKSLGFQFSSLTRFIFLTSLTFSFTANAEITVTEVANGRAVIKFDKTDDITTNSKLVLKELSVAGSPNPDSQNTCTQCPQPEAVMPKRTHLIAGSLKSIKQDETAKSGSTSVSADTTSVELEGSYYYNFGHFGLGATYSSTKEDSDGDVTLVSSFGVGGRYFFIPNQAKNNIIPYVGLAIIAANVELPATPKITAKLSGSKLEFGANFYVSQSAFLDVRYSSGVAEGDLKQGSTTVDYEVEQRGLSVGIGIALE